MSELTLRSLASLDGDARKKLALESYLSAVVCNQFGGVCVCVCVCVCEFPQEAVVFSQFAVRVYMSVNSLWRHFSCVWYMCVHVLMCVCVVYVCNMC